MQPEGCTVPNFMHFAALKADTGGHGSPHHLLPLHKVCILLFLHQKGFAHPMLLVQAMRQHLALPVLLLGTILPTQSIGKNYFT